MEANELNAGLHLLPLLMPPAPADSFLPIWSVGELPWLSAAMFDANVKLNRYASAGRSGGYDEAEPVLSRFLDKAHRQLWLMKESGELSSTQRQRAALDADDISIELGGECQPRLSCARESSLYSGISDDCGLVGGVCSHGQPLLGTFMTMPAPERFVYYDLALQELLLSTRLDTMYLDTGCTYSRHRQLYLSAAPAPRRICVPWWHARGHGARCCLRNSGLYLPGELPQALACCRTAISLCYPYVMAVVTLLTVVVSDPVLAGNNHASKCVAIPKLCYCCSYLRNRP
jgi:hypothetical protein